MTPLSRLLVDAGVASQARVRAYEEALERPLRPSWEDAPLYYSAHEEDGCSGKRWCRCPMHTAMRTGDTPEARARANRAAHIMRERARGRSYQEIGTRLGVSRQAVHRFVTKYGAGAR